MKSNRKERRDGDFMDHETAFYSFILEVEINGMIPCYFKHDFASYILRHKCLESGGILFVFLHLFQSFLMAK